MPSMHRKHSSNGRRSRIHGRNSGGVHREAQKSFPGESSRSVSENKGEKTDFMRDELGAPKVVDLSTFRAELDALRVREKAHTHGGDAIAAARRRLPMVEVDSATPLTGERAYYFMWSTGHPATEQCARGAPGLHRRSASCPNIHSRDVYLRQGSNVFETY